MAEINEFDDQLKDALSNLGNDISPGDWDSFAEKLSAADGLSPMEEPSGFDDLIRTQMDNLEVATDTNHWEVLESKIDQELNAPEISNEALDQLANDNLSNLYIPYNPTHWTLMSHRLEEEFNVRRKIVNYKVAEFSLMVLLMITIVQFMPSYLTNHDENVATEEQADLLETNAISNAIASPSPTYLTSSAKQASNENAILNISANTIASATVTTKKSAATIMLANENNIPIITLSTPSEMISVGTAKENIVKIESEPLIVEDPINTINQSTSLLLDLPVTITALDHSTDWSRIGILKKFSKKVVVRLGAMTSTDLNQIKTPSTSRFKDNGYQQYRLGYGGGITLDLNYEKLTLSTGLIYRRINYYPQEDINIAGSFTNGYQSHVFDAVNLNLLTVPMNLQFQINSPDKKWKLHAVTGASLNMLVLNHYNVTVHNLGRSSTSSVPIPPPASAGSEPTSSPVELEREADIAGEGFFEGGSFKRNHYFTANIGVGVERYISPRWSLFIQPIYQHEIFGKNLGLNRDRIHTFSIQVGAKSTFK